MRLIEKIKAKVKYELGIDKIERNYESLYFLMNNCIDITKLPETKDKDLRWLQKCDTLLMDIFGILCQKHGLTYWIDYGNLLGAVRHRGFIPWDDDSDVSMMREDMERVIPLMREEVESYGLALKSAIMHPLRCSILSYKEDTTGVWLDIFPMDTYTSDDSREQVKEKIERYRQIFWEHVDWTAEKLTTVKNEIFQSKPNAAHDYIITSLETWKGDKQIIIHERKDIFPIGQMTFDGGEKNVPADADTYLRHIYGKNYMSFPRNAINTHGREDTPLGIIKKNGTDMQQIYNELQSIYNQLTKEHQAK